MAESKMAEFNMESFKMVANELSQMVISLGQSQSGGRVFLSELREDNKVSESKMAVSDPRWQIQDGCHHQVKWEWMSQIELVWVRVRMEGECYLS